MNKAMGVKIAAMFLMAAGGSLVFFETQGEVAEYSALFYVGAVLVVVGVLIATGQSIANKFKPR